MKCFFPQTEGFLLMQSIAVDIMLIIIIITISTVIFFRTLLQIFYSLILFFSLIVIFCPYPGMHCHNLSVLDFTKKTNLESQIYG